MSDHAMGPGSGALPPLASVVVAASLAVGFAVGPSAAQSRSIVIEEMHAVYEVQTNGDVQVEERFRVRFNGSWNGLRRVLELDPPAGYPWTDPVGFRLDATTNADGEPRENEVHSEGRATRDIRVYVPNANNRTASVVIRYTLSGALGFYAADAGRDLPAMDELYWNVTGADWDVALQTVTAEVHLPLGAAISQAAAYQGRTGSGDQVGVTFDGSTARVRAEGSIRPGEELTLGVGWPAGAVQRDPSRVMAWGDESLQDRLAGAQPGPLTYLPLALPLLALWFGYRAWNRRGRDPKARAIVVRWEPPEDLSPAEAGTLVDHTPGMHDIISTLVELAVKGYVVIEEREKTRFLKFGKDYVFHLVRDRGEWGDLLPHQRRFLDGLFKHRSDGVGGILKTALGLEKDAQVDAPAGALASVELSDLKNEFYKEIPDIKDAIFDALVRKGHYLRRPDRVRGLWIGGAVVLAVAGIGAFAALSESNPVLGLITAAAAFASALILGFFALIMPARTEKGARTREAALGFRQFLEKVESPRYKRMIQSPEQFEQYLPYAMAFQCQEEWARAFDDILTEPPDWYYGGHGHFHASSFASDMGTMASTAGTAMASSPSSSGSGGGGSAGGGGGGGGGGGF